MSKTITTVLLVILALVGGYFIYDQYQEVQRVSTNGPTTTEDGILNGDGIWNDTDEQNNVTTTADVPDDWVSYSTSTYSFSAPPEATVQTEASITKVKMIGEGSTTGTEITDGFVFYVTTVQDFDWEQFRTSTQELSPEDVMIGDRPATRYTTTTEMGNISTRVVMESETNTSTVFVISYSVMDPNNEGYEDMINTMIESLQLQNTSNARL